MEKTDGIDGIPLLWRFNAGDSILRNQRSHAKHFGHRDALRQNKPLKQKCYFVSAMDK